MMAAYFLTPIYTSLKKRQLISDGIKRTSCCNDQITPDEGNRQECRNVGSMNGSYFDYIQTRKLNQSSIKPCHIPNHYQRIFLSRSQHSRHGVQRNCVRQVNHSEVLDGQQTLTHVYWTKSCNQASRLVTTLAVKTKRNARSV